MWLKVFYCIYRQWDIFDIFYINIYFIFNIHIVRKLLHFQQPRFLTLTWNFSLLWTRIYKKCKQSRSERSMLPYVILCCCVQTPFFFLLFFFVNPHFADCLLPSHLHFQRGDPYRGVHWLLISNHMLLPWPLGFKGQKNIPWFPRIGLY